MNNNSQQPGSYSHPTHQPSLSQNYSQQQAIRIQDQDQNIQNRHFISQQQQQQNSIYQQENDYYGGTEAMEYTPSASSNRNIQNAGNNPYTASQTMNAPNPFNQQQYSAHTSQQQLSNNQNYGLLTDLNSAASVKSQNDNTRGHRQSQNSESGIVNKFDFEGNQNNLGSGNMNDPTDALLDQHFNMLLGQQKSGSTMGSQRNPMHQQNLPNVNAQLNQNVDQAPNQLNNYNSNRSFTSISAGRNNAQTPGFQSLNQSNAAELLPVQNQNQNLPQLNGNHSQQNLVEQLSLKVKTQAERLQFLENYKTLCERRIRDFDQNHQLPILPSHIGIKPPQIQPQQQTTQFDSILHQKIQDLQQQLHQKNDMKQRLSQAEESLRQETLQNEEQRAYIKVLRQNLEQKLNQEGLVFKNNANHQTGFDSNVDGYMHLINQKRELDVLQKENQKLMQHLQDTAIQNEKGEKAMLSQFQIKIEELKQSHNLEVAQLQAKVAHVKSKKTILKKDKNQLLDFVEESLQKQQIEEKLKLELQDEQKRQDSLINQLKQRLEDLQIDKKHQDDLLLQVQQNLRVMREEKEKLQTTQNETKFELENKVKDIKIMHQQLDSIEETLGSTKRVANDLDRNLSEKTKEVERLSFELQRKEREVESLIKGQQETGKEKSHLIDVLRSQLDDQTKKSYALEDANMQLQRTLTASQKELDSLIAQYENLSKSHKLQTSEFLVMKKRLDEALQELDNRTRTYNETKLKEDTLQNELQEIYGSLQNKTKLQIDQEQRLLRNLQDKDNDFAKLLKKYEKQELLNNEQSQRIEDLLRQKDEKDREADKLRHTIELKKNIIDDIQQQLIRTKADFENQHLTTQRTLNLAQTDLERKDQEYTQKISTLQQDLKSLKDQKYMAEKILGEKVEKNREMEIQRVKLEEKLKRLESDIGKLENNQGVEKQKQGQIQGEIERFRSQRVDDSMLIEKLRLNLDQSKSGLNELIGVISSFQPYLEQLVASSDNDLNGFDIATKELTSLYEQLMALKRQPHNLNNHSLTHSPPQKEDWNVPQRINHLVYQQTFSNPFNDEVLNENTMKNMTSNDYQKLQATHENLKVTLDQLQDEKQKHILAKQKLDSLVEQQSLDKQHIQDLEQLLRKFIAQKSIDRKLQRVMSDLFDNTRDLIMLRSDKNTLTRSLTAKEQRYHTLNKANISEMTNYQREITMLKGAIERERQNVKELDLRVDEHSRRQLVLQDELSNIDSVLSNKDYDKEIQSHGLQSENEELRKALAATQQDKEWAERRFLELESQLNRFNMPSSLSRIENTRSEKKEERNEISPVHTIDNRSIQRDSTRLQWPKKRENSLQNDEFFNERQPSSNLVNYKARESTSHQQYKRNQSSERKPDIYVQQNQSHNVGVLNTDSYSLDNFARRQQDPYRTAGQSISNLPLQSNQEQYNHHEIPNRSFHNVVYSQEQSIQLPPPNQIYSDAYLPDNIKPATANQSQHLYSSFDNNGEQSSSVLKNKIQQVKTMFNQIRRNIDQ
eukprot:403356124